MLQGRNKRKKLLGGNILITAFIFLFLLAGALRLCYTNTLHETKLANIFVQETQGFYLLENLMHLARDYAYQIVQNPREPHLFLSASAYKDKDKLNFKKEDGTYNEGWVVDFNGSLSKQQIVPDDFPLQIEIDPENGKSGWEIRGGPIFWQDNRKKNAEGAIDTNDERYLAEVFMLGSLNLKSDFHPNWTMRTVQTMEIERNPLCDFQLYAEGDTTITTNISNTDRQITINGPVQINGNTRFSCSNGVADNKVLFYNKFNSAGYALYMEGYEVGDYILPKKYHMLDNHENYQRTQGTGANGFFLNRYAINYGVSTFRLSASHNNFSENVVTNSAMYNSGYNHNNFESYERCVFALYNGNYTTRSRVYRPIGFDPENYWGFWEASYRPTVGIGVEENKQILNHCFGFHGLAQGSVKDDPDIFFQNPNYGTWKAMQELRKLDAYQATEKSRLVEMQKPINFPIIKILLWQGMESKDKDDISFYVPNNFIYPTYLSSAFPATKDNIYLNRYLSLVFPFRAGGIITGFRLYYTVPGTQKYAYALTKQLVLSDGDFLQDPVHMKISSNKLCSCACDSKVLVGGKFVKFSSSSSGVDYDDDSAAPDKLIEKVDTVNYVRYWTLDHYVTRIDDFHYNFMYDRNRAKWIQIIEIDVSRLKSTLEALDIWNNGDVMPIVCVQTRWQGEDATFINKNYRLDTKGNDNGTDIRYNYQENRKNFFKDKKKAEGSYVYPNDTSHPPVIDMGVRLINASELPERGLTFYCPYPLYIKGNFNSTSPKPALIVTDSITILPDTWQDWRSQMDPIKSHLWYDGSSYTDHPKLTDSISIYADIITGRTHPHFWIQDPDTVAIDPKPINQTQAPNPDLGIHDAFRTLCDLDKPINLYGSLMLPYFCQEQWEPPINFCKVRNEHPTNPSILFNPLDPINYAPPDINLNKRTFGIPAAMPFYYRINRGRKTHCIGSIIYEGLISELYNKNWAEEANTFSDYHSALPNYLKYEVDP